MQDIEAVIRWVETNATKTATGLAIPNPANIAAFDHPLSEGLRELYRLADGASAFGPDDEFLGTVLPYAYLYSLADSDAEWHNARDAQDVVTRAGFLVNDPFHAEYVPFAGLDGNFYFVDMRAGEQQGSVGWWDGVEGAEMSRWTNVEHMFGELLVALESGTAFENATPMVSAGVVDWT